MLPTFGKYTFQQADKGHSQGQLTLIITAIGQCEFEPESRGGNEPRAVAYHYAQPA